ncbi:VOC family protein [Flavobacterium sp.]|uniref:VOC family protein n=1 Tax=Flavobacterium sp. TaxID=239 RepID=UPI003C32EDEC
MTQWNPYLTFDGNCREAMLFYQYSLGGQLLMQTVGETPMAEKLPQNIQHFILHASLSVNHNLLMGSDLVCDKGLNKGNSVAIALHCSSEIEINKYYSSLSAKGQINQPLSESHWGTLFGDITDQFGVHWFLYYDKKN